MIGLNEEKKNTLFYSPVYIIVFATGMSINSNILKWIIVVIFAIFLLNDFLHMIIEIISLFATTKREKSHVLLYTFPAVIALTIWCFLWYNMFNNFDLVN